MRDSYIRGTTLNAGQFPFAEFRLKEIGGFPQDYVEGREIELALTGDMTIRGVTRPLTLAVRARRVGGTLTAVADTDFKMTDFGIEPPNVAVSRAEDNVHLQVVLVASLQRETGGQ